MSSASLVVVAGEASGDRAAAAVVAELHRESPELACFGIGGPACAAAGVRFVADAPFGAAGFFPVLRRAASVVRSFRAIVAAARAERPAAALLVDWTEFNQRLAPELRALGTKVLWYGAPQVWAWRASRLRTLAPRVDAMAVVLPFEEALWRSAGADATYVGHPSLRPLPEPPARVELRRALGLAPGRALALLPGSRPAEVRALLEPMLDAAVRLRRELLAVEPRLVLAPGLPVELAAWARGAGSAAGVPVLAASPDGASELLPAFDGALVASGTASLEAALAGAHPVVAYRTDRATAALLGLLVRTPWIALPNVILGRGEWPELLQNDASGPRMAAEMRKVLERRARLDDAARELRECLGEERNPRSLVAARLRAWLPSGSRPEPQRPRRPAPSSTTSSSP